MNINNALKSSVMRLMQNKKTQQNLYCSMAMLFEKITLWYSLLHYLYM